MDIFKHTHKNREDSKINISLFIPSYNNHLLMNIIPFYSKIYLLYCLRLVLYRRKANRCMKLTC